MLPTSYQKLIHLSRYARWVPGENRRETWDETVDRYITFFRKRFPTQNIPWDDLRQGIFDLDVMPSMRCLMTAGEALERDNCAGYNCAYLAVNNKECFSETLYILMCGTGVGFSVEQAEVNKLPIVPGVIKQGRQVHAVEDSRYGWRDAFAAHINALFNGEIVEFLYHNVRPAGARLKTFGGRASGPEPLKSLMKFATDTFMHARGRRLSDVECHDLMCKVAEVVVCGGVRRSALISLSDINSRLMRTAKSGDWWVENGPRALANNSFVIDGGISREDFDVEWDALVASGSGERGVFSRDAARAMRPARRKDAMFGCNPCSEISLRDKQFCNLSEVVVRDGDNRQSLKRKVFLATILGTLQSSLNDLPQLSDAWGQNTSEERLLGVSMTGVCDNVFMSTPSADLRDQLVYLREYAVTVNEVYADRLGIPHSAAVTCVKPSGTVSQLVDAASGLHRRHSAHYVRRIRMDSKDPLAVELVKQGFPNEVDFYNASALVFSFPFSAPEGVALRDDVSAIDQLELWKFYQTYWCEHKPSVTISVREEEWEVVREWMWDNMDTCSGVSFLPHSNHTYVQAPYTACDEQEIIDLTARIPSLDLDDYREFDDNTTSSQELACVAGGCELP
jgi:ribonucleoside-triphosphate reductase